MNQPLKIDWHSAQRLNDAVAGEIDAPITLQAFDDKGANLDLARWRHGRLSDSTIRAWATVKNSEGAGVYWTPNKMDGQGRRKSNAVECRCVWVDLDGTPLPKTFHADPQAIVESSSGKYHVYWFIQATTEFDLWRDTQAWLAAYYQGDPKVKDVPRVLRLPGFYHQKAKPHCTRLLRLRNVDMFDRPTLEDFRESLPECEYPKQIARELDFESREATEDNERDVQRAETYIAKQKKPATGERNNKLYAMACQLSDFGISEGKSVELLSEWNESLDDPLSDDELHATIEHATEYKESPAGSVSVSREVNDFDDTPLDDDTETTKEGDKDSKPGKFKAQTISALQALPSPKWLLDRLMTTTGLYEIYGKFKSGKTFWGVEIACCIATSHDFFGSKVAQGKVIYVIGEGSRKLFSYRITEWARERAQDEADRKRLLALLESNLQVVPFAVGMDTKQVQSFIADNPSKVALVIIDTLFRSMRGDVTNAQDFARFVKGCDLVRDKLGGALLFLHHQKRSEAKGGFGSVVGEASVDGAFKVSGSSNETQFKVEIMRDGEVPPKPWNAKIESRKIVDPALTDSDIRETAVLVFTGQKATPEDLLDLINETAFASVEELAQAAFVSRRTAFRYLDKLREQGLVSADWPVTLTDAGLSKANGGDDFDGLEDDDFE